MKQSLFVKTYVIINLDILYGNGNVHNTFYYIFQKLTENDGLLFENFKLAPFRPSKSRLKFKFTCSVTSILFKKPQP